MTKVIITVIFCIFWELNAQVALPTFQGAQIQYCDNTLTVNQSDRGWYISNGNHGASNQNTITGPGYNDARSWFTFDLTGFSGGACAVTLRLELERYSSTASSVTSTIYDVSTSHDDLVASHSSGSSSGQTIYADLGAGNSYGSATFASGDVGDIIEYTLSSQAVSDVNSAAGAWFSVGTTMANNNNDGYIRFSASNESRTHQLVIKY